MMKPIEASEREPIEARRKSLPEREAARPGEPTAEASTHHRATKASTYRRAANATANRRAAEASTHRPAANATANRRTVEASTHRPAVASTHRPAASAPTKAPAAVAPAPLGIRGRRRCHRAREGDSGERDYDLTHHGVSSICRVKHPDCRSLLLKSVTHIVSRH